LPNGERGDLPTVGAGDEARDSTGLVPQTEPDRRSPRWFAATGWLVCGVAGSLAIVWFIFRSPGEIGSRAEWFFGAVVFAAVLVTLWQTLTIQRQARLDPVAAAERLRKELAAAEERSARELEQLQTLHRAEMEAHRELARAEIEAQRELARAEMEAQQELARVEMKAQRDMARLQRMYLLEQQQKQAMIAVSRSVGAHTQMLASLWNQGANILLIEDSDERDQAMRPVFEQIGQVVNDFSVELANAHLLIEDNRLHHALNRVNDAVLMAIRVAEDIHEAVVEGRTPHPIPSPPYSSSCTKEPQKLGTSHGPCSGLDSTTTQPRRSRSTCISLFRSDIGGAQPHSHGHVRTLLSANRRLATPRRRGTTWTCVGSTAAHTARAT
jgi:hypothetical protein